MASYNAGRSLAHLLTNGAFDAMTSDQDGYVSVSQAAEQLLTRRSSGFRRNRAGSTADADTDEGDGSGGASMRNFVEHTVASFGISRPGYLNRREFARMYETFVKRPAQFAQLIGAAAAATTEAEDKLQSGGEGSGGPSLAPGPPMSHQQLRSLVDQVNERLAEEQSNKAGSSGCTSGCASSCASGPGGGFVLLGGQGAGKDEGGEKKRDAKAGKLFEEDLQLD